MSVSNGQDANENTFNTSFVSREVDDNKAAKLTLDDPDTGTSGTQIANVQRELNSKASFVGQPTNQPENDKPAWSSDVIGTPNESVKERVDAVQAEVETNQTNIATNTANISGNTSDIADVRAAQGTADGDTDLGTGFGTVISSNPTTKSALIELETALEGILDGLDFQGTWNANTNTPTLTSGTGTKGHFYIVDTPGNTNLDGITDWNNGDWAVFDGTVWRQVDNTDSVTSVAGKTGAVSLDAADITDFDTEVSNNPDVVSNTAKVSADGSIDTHSDVDTTTTAPSVDDALVWDGSNWVPAAQTGGSGAGKKNYFEGGNFESDISLASVYDDGGSYVDGTGGIPAEISISQTGFSIAGDNSLAIDKAGTVSAVGEGVSLTSQTIDLVDLGKDLFFEFAYDANDTNYTTGDVVVKAYDINNAEELAVVPIANLTDGAGLFKNLTTAYGKVLTNSNTQSVRLSLHVETDTVVSSAWTITVDEAIIGPSGILVGSVLEGPVEFTPTGSWTTNTTYSGKWYRIGDSMLIEYDIALSGLPDNLDLTLEMPAGYIIDTSKLLRPPTSVYFYPESKVIIYDSGTGWNTAGAVRYVDQNTFRLTYTAVTSSNDAENARSINQNSPMTFSNNDAVFAYVKVPIVGWDNGNLLSANETSYKSIYSEMSRVASQSIGSSSGFSGINFDTVVDDDFGIANLSTNRIEIPKTQRYTVRASVNFEFNATGDRGVQISYNAGAGDIEIARMYSAPNPTSEVTVLEVSKTINLPDNSEVRINVLQSSGSTLNVTANLSVKAEPDLTTFGTYSETDYKEALATSIVPTTAVNTYEGVTACTVTLEPGLWDIGHETSLYHEYVSGGPHNSIGNAAIGVVGGAILDSTIAQCGQWNISSSNDNHMHNVAGSTRITITSPTTYRLFIRSNLAPASLLLNAVGGNFTGGLSDPENATKIWARRVK